VGPLVAAIAVALLTSLWAEPGFDPWYGARVVAAAIVLFAVRAELPRPRLSLAAFPALVGAAVGAAWIAWPHAGGSAPLALAHLEPPARAAWIAVRVAGSCLVLPVIEELAFRGFLLRWLVASEFEAVPPRAWTWPAVIVSSLAFGAVHDNLVLGACAGGAFAAARLSRGRLSDAVLAHALANVAIAVAVVAFGRWDLWI
jgi:CAAX prenyl protease-like protein